MLDFANALLALITDFLGAVLWDNFVVSFPLMMVVFSILVLMVRKLVGLR